MSETARRLHDRAKAFGMTVPPHAEARLVTYFDLLFRWNQKINLTSLSNIDEAIDRLLLEPVAAARELPHSPGIIDLGSGGGSPAIPLALALSATLLVMVESRSRKAAFLREAVRELGMNAVVEAARFEEVAARPDYQGGMDVVSIRAVRMDSPAWTAAAVFLKSQGTVALFTTAEANPLEDLPETLVWQKTTPLLNRAQLVLLSRP
jgi:16S rRNA (guanine527-N7)-methyltransferase